MFSAHNDDKIAASNFLYCVSFHCENTSIEVEKNKASVLFLKQQYKIFQLILNIQL